MRRIIRGYRRRDTLKHQLLAECVWAAIYAMRDPKGKTVKDLFPSIFEDDDDDYPDDDSPITDSEIRELQQLMAENNTPPAPTAPDA